MVFAQRFLSDSERVIQQVRRFFVLILVPKINRDGSDDGFYGPTVTPVEGGKGAELYSPVHER